MSELFDDLQWRGLVHQITDPALPKLLDGDSLTFYVGFDPTAPSLHIGNLLQLCNLRRLQEGGHRPVALAGGGTGMIGDPGGKSEERNLLTAEQLEANLAGIKRQLERFVDFSGGRALLVDNGEWLWRVNVLEFLRDVGKHFTVNQMIAKESVRARIERPEQGISYTEFSYMLLQAFDFLQLHDRHGCRLQLGGSDQWGNITMGVELIRKVRGEEAYGLTSPLVLNPDGTKMGKSAAGETVWLDAERTSPYALFQHFVRADDSVVGTYLRYFTWLDRARIEELDAATREHPERREAQRVLAFEVTALVHGRDEAERARLASEVLYTERVVELDAATFGAVGAEAGVTALGGDGASLVDALVASGLSPSKSAARTAIGQGGVYVNGRREPEDRTLSAAADALDGGFVVLRRGKRELRLLRFEPSSSRS